MIGKSNILFWTGETAWRLIALLWCHSAMFQNFSDTVRQSWFLMYHIRSQMLLVQMRSAHVNHNFVKNTWKNIIFLKSESLTLIPLSMVNVPVILLGQPTHTQLLIDPGLDHLALYFLNSFLIPISVLLTLPWSLVNIEPSYNEDFP